MSKLYWLREELIFIDIKGFAQLVGWIEVNTPEASIFEQNKWSDWVNKDCCWKQVLDYDAECMHTNLWLNTTELYATCSWIPFIQSFSFGVSARECCNDNELNSRITRREN